MVKKYLYTVQLQLLLERYCIFIYKMLFLTEVGIKGAATSDSLLWGTKKHQLCSALNLARRTIYDIFLFAPREVGYPRCWAHVPRKSRLLPLLPAEWWRPYEKHMSCSRRSDFSWTDTYWAHISFKWISGFICDCACWWDFLVGFDFCLGNRTFWRCNAFHCSSMWGQRTGSFDQMIKVHCSICKTYVYWIYFITTISYTHTEPSLPSALSVTQISLLIVFASIALPHGVVTVPTFYQRASSVFL